MVEKEGRDPFYLDFIAENKLEIKAKKDIVEALEFWRDRHRSSRNDLSDAGGLGALGKRLVGPSPTKAPFSRLSKKTRE